MTFTFVFLSGSASFNLITFWLPYTDNHCKLFANLFNALFIALTILVIYLKVPIVTSTVPLIGKYVKRLNPGAYLIILQGGRLNFVTICYKDIIFLDIIFFNFLLLYHINSKYKSKESNRSHRHL